MSDEPYHIQNRHSFYISDGDDVTIGGIDVIRRDGVLFLTNLWVKPEHRRKGLARRLVKEALRQYGDQTLYLHVSAYTNQPLTETELLEWYGTFWFEPIPDAPLMMVRHPFDAKPTTTRRDSGDTPDDA